MKEAFEQDKTSWRFRRGNLYVDVEHYEAGED